MALLKNSLSGELCLLRAHHLFGRDASRCDTVLNTPYASHLHADIRWLGTQWRLHDHSRNGTRVAGRLLHTGEYAELRCGDLIHFGQVGDALWLVEDLDDPFDALWPLDGRTPVLRLEQRHRLPAPHGARAELRRGRDGNWQLHEADRVRPLRDGDEIHLGALAWRLLLAPHHATLQMALPASWGSQTTYLEFTVSQDEEHVQAVLHERGRRLDLGERAHHYCLATLARERHAAIQAGQDAHTQGWIELGRLARMLGQPIQHINVQIHRARKQLAALSPEEAERLLQRRRGCVRFGTLPFRVFRGDALECQWLPEQRQPTGEPPRTLAANEG